MEKILVKGDWYTVTTATTCTITAADGKLLATAEPGKQCTFKATTERILFSDDNADVQANPKFAPTVGSGGGGGASIKFDTTPKSGSTNAVTSGGLFNLLKESGIAIGRATVTPEFYGISIGSESSTKGWGAISMGKDAKVNGVASISIGANVQADTSIGLGRLLTVKDAGVVAMSPPNKTDPQTIFYLIGASTPLANTYENGEACLGYVVKDSSGNILACGTRKLSELLTNNTSFAPAALDLDAPAPTPFLPTGIMEPIEDDPEAAQDELLTNN